MAQVPIEQAGDRLVRTPFFARRLLAEAGIAPVERAARMPSYSLERFAVLGRLLIAQIFLMAGTFKFLSWSDTAATMEQHGIPLIPLALPAAALTEIIGGLMILIGFKARLGALFLFLFLIPTTLLFHNFWAFDDAQERQMQMINFMKNLAIMGGLWMIVCLGAGGMSFDSRNRHSEVNHA